MVIVHRDELDPLIAARLPRRKATSGPLEYLVLGTVEPGVWRRGLAGGVSFDEFLKSMADFNAYVEIEHTRRGWVPAK